MTHEEAFLRAIEAEPEVEAHRLVYADWLDEQGEGARAALLRVQCQLGRLPPDDERWPLLARREQAILDELRQGWLGPFRDAVADWQFDRGLVAGVALDTQSFLEHGEALCARLHVGHFHVFHDTTCAAECAELAELTSHPLFGRVRRLDLRNKVLVPDDVRALGESPHVAGLFELHLEGNLLGAEGAEAIARSRHLGRLTTLRLSRNLLGDAGVAALADWARMPGLTELDVSQNSVTDVGLAVLAHSRLMEGLTVLDVSYNALTDRGVGAFCLSAKVQNLTGLNLARNFLSDAGLEILSRCAYLQGLRGLDLHGNHITSAGLDAWGTSPHIGRLMGYHLGRRGG